jgi:capsule biosynthesis phosphatase|tara:strand:- start:10002 stop:11036 length:1035 start_codon:yes stop_codon:yes gene_type:complete
MYHKRIVVDFDDTLAFHQNREFDKALPNKPLIKKLNKLHADGWQIDIFTARGSISCETREDARDKYEKSMLKWLNKHKVKFNMLSFDKPLAAYYIDDKGIMPEDFLEVDIRELEGGLSGGEIFTDGKVVHKQDNNAHQTRDWFERAEKIGIKTPAIHRVVGETITMDYIDHDENFFKENFWMALATVQTQLDKMKSLKPVNNKSYITFSSYIDRIEEHAKNSGQKKLMDVASSLNKYKIKRGYSHGDFGIKNILFNNCDAHLIDPICDVFGSTELDAAKFCASLLINKYPKKLFGRSLNYLAMANDINRDMLISLVAAEVTRVYKYHPNKDFIMECIDNVYKQS